MRLKKAFRAALVVAALATGIGVLSATPAYASSLVCNPLNGVSRDPCSHQTSIEINVNSTTYGASGSRTAWWGPFTVLKMQKDGNLVLYCQNNGYIEQAIWASNTAAANYDAWVTFGGLGHVSVWHSEWRQGLGGNWFLYNVKGWDSGTDTGGAGASLIIQADGNMVIWNTFYGRAMWASNTYHACGNGDQNYWVGYQ